MGFDHVADAAFRPSRRTDLFRVEAVAAHRFGDGDAVRILKVIAVSRVAVAEHRAGAEIPGAKAHPFFVAEAGDDVIVLEGFAAFLEQTGNFDGGNHAADAVVIAAVDDGVVVGAAHYAGQ